MRRVALVTGGAGYIGSHLVLALREAGWRPVVLDDLSTGCCNALPKDVRLVRGDVGDSELLHTLFAAERPRAVLHLAGSVSAPRSVAEPMRYYDNNTAKSGVLIRAAQAAPVRPLFVFSSSAAVYGMSPPRVREDAPTAPLNPYGASKLMTERMLADVGAAVGLRHVSLRYFNVAGADPLGRGSSRTGGEGSLLQVALETARGLRRHVPIYGQDHPTRDGTGVRDYIHVCDLARAHLAALEALEAGTAPAIINCGYGEGVSVLEMIAAVEQVTGVRLQRFAAARRPGDPSEVVADNTRLLRCTTWRPRRAQLTQMIRDAWLRVRDRERLVATTRSDACGHVGRAREVVGPAGLEPATRPL